MNPTHNNNLDPIYAIGYGARTKMITAVAKRLKHGNAPDTKIQFCPYTQSEVPAMASSVVINVSNSVLYGHFLFGDIIMTNQSKTPSFNQPTASCGGAPEQQEIQPQGNDLWIKVKVASDGMSTLLECAKAVGKILKKSPHVSSPMASLEGLGVFWIDQVNVWQHLSICKEWWSEDSENILHVGDVVKGVA